jgi:hypothetical protein
MCPSIPEPHERAAEWLSRIASAETMRKSGSQSLATEPHPCPPQPFSKRSARHAAKPAPRRLEIVGQSPQSKNAPEFDEPIDQEESYRTNLGSYYYRDRETDAL